MLRVLRKEQGNVTGWLGNFRNDPLVEGKNNLSIKVEDALEVIERKLSGRVGTSGTGGSLTVEEQVEQVILNAINDHSLSKMYIGWMPWL